MSVNVGSIAPDFTLPGAGGVTGKEGSEITLSAYRGKTHVLLAFYPADFSPVCTTEMQSFAKDWSEFRTLGCEILGISADPLDQHRAFAEKLRLEFPLLSDADKSVSRLYGVNSLLGMRRAYFIVDLGGIIRYKHVELLPITRRENSELLQALRSLTLA